MRVAMMLYAGFQLLEVSGPMDVFEEANRVCGERFYVQHVIGPTLGPVLEPQPDRRDRTGAAPGPNRTGWGRPRSRDDRRGAAPDR